MKNQIIAESKKRQESVIGWALLIFMGILVLLAQSAGAWNNIGIAKSASAQSLVQGYWKLGEIKKVNNLKPDVPGGWHTRADMSDGTIEYYASFSDAQYKWVATWPSAPAALIPGQEVSLNLSISQAVRKGGFHFTHILLARFDGFGINIGYVGCGADFTTGKDKHQVSVDTS